MVAIVRVYAATSSRSVAQSPVTCLSRTSLPVAVQNDGASMFVRSSSIEARRATESMIFV